MPVRTHKHCRAARRGFTLIEVLIVVVLLGILASIAIMQLTVTGDEAARTSFVASGRVLVEAGERYRLFEGQYLPDGASGVLPPGFEPYLHETAWGETPIGGVWDTELNENGVTSAIGVHFDGTGETRDDAYMTVIDGMTDDGDLTAGGFRKIAADRYYYIIAD